MRGFRWLLVLAVLLAPVSVFAQQSSQSRVIYSNPTNGARALLSGVALNAAANLRTISLSVAGRSNLSIQVDLTRVAATTLTMSCKSSLNGGLTYADITDQIVTSGVGTLAPHVWSRDVTGGSSGTIIDMSVGTYDAVQCVFSGASAGASDLISVYAIGGARI